MSISHFTAQIWLGFLAVIALIALGYVLVQRNRRKHMLKFTNMELLEKVAPSRPSPFRHVAVALLLVGLVFLTVAAAGPTAVKKVPRNRATVMLVMDVSLSMEATDVAPSRIQVAKKAAKEFVDGLPEGVNIGFVTFAGTASVMVSPTTNHEGVKASIDNVRLAERTATGEGILTALQAIETLATVLGGAQEPPPARIVLMSDGKQTVPAFEDVDNPRHEYVAARLAKTKNVPISTISFGTSWGEVEIPREDGSKDRVRVAVDDDAMRELARLSGGEFYTASSLQELTKVYDTLEQQIGYELTRGDASRPWLLLGLLVIATGVITGLLYRQRLP
ncbi:VWA domain-containing protein [Nocardia beijingensis]|uniref:Membrane protein n=1 Tax=Nocardia sputorum TaxID=2984338 RepID=A0ABM8CVU8_9NOCA|nr:MULTISPECIES: VWA domain-containing protein [Nocardia]MBF6463690.1 VWA domain-containing protein [Nocardia beijingensis]BDT90479.1 membrane protein [Nocardia sputorum]BDT99098.1 membrane protein [Nocardia sputorum]